MLASRHRALAGALVILAGFLFTPGSSLVPLESSAVFAQGPEPRAKVLIGFRGAVNADDESVVRAAGGRVTRRFRIVTAIAAELPPRAIAALQSHSRIAVIEPDVAIHAVDAELDNSWGVKRIGSGTVHDAGNKGAGIKIAVLDTGIDYNHPDLAANYGGGWDFVNNDADPFDDNFHGTHVAGSIAGRDDDAGVVGVAPEATIYALKVLDQNGNGSFSGVISALDWAVQNGIQITSNSYGSSTNPGTLVQQAFANASNAGLLHVAAAGNTGNCAGTGDTVIFPAKYDSVIAVAAIDNTDTVACFSSHGPKVELAAPGVAVTSTVPGGGYNTFNGTSMATPHVSGVAALVLARGVADTNANGRINDELRSILTQTAQDLGAVRARHALRLRAGGRGRGGRRSSAAVTRGWRHGDDQQGDLHQGRRYHGAADGGGDQRVRRADRRTRVRGVYDDGGWRRSGGDVQRDGDRRPLRRHGRHQCARRSDRMQPR